LLDAFHLSPRFRGKVSVVRREKLLRFGKLLVGAREPLGKCGDLEETLVFTTQRSARLRVTQRPGVTQLLLNGGGPFDRRRETCSNAQVFFFPAAYF
jgi:hypothetical protein